MNRSVRSIGVVLAVYNGETFLSPQIESISQQECSDWDLYIRDDCSNDNSQAIVEKFSRTDNRVHVVTDKKKNLGARDNFAFLLELSELTSYNYVSFSDQDDIWHHDKLEIQLEMMQQIEKFYPERPCLVHSNMEVVDSSLRKIDESFMKYQGIQHEANALPVLLAQNFVTGCTMLANRKLLDIALPIPDVALMHDWWLALCAAVFGHIAYIDKPLVKYRQHERNAVGAKHLADFLSPVSGKWKKRWYEGRDNLFKSMKQAEALADRIRQHDPKNPNLELVEAYAALQNMPPLKRIGRLHVLGIHAQSRSRQALLLSRLLLTSKTQYG